MNMNIPEYNVSQFNQIFKEVIETNFDYVRIKGEISELKNASSGHMYLTLKDKDSILNAIIWSQKKNYLTIIPEIGMEVIASGKISTYAKSISTYSINIDNLELAGEGALLKLIEDRKKRLKKSGIFDLEYKKEIPYLPNKIGVITSSSGSVIHDIINRVKDRFPVNIDIWPVPVQGSNAPEKIIEAIKGFNLNNYDIKPDVIIIARGGGSTEDLMAFNDENLALAVFNSSIPIISAIGHETDTTIIDLVSDLRTSTPTAAAEKAVPKMFELKESLNKIYSVLKNFINFKIDNTFLKISSLSKSLKSPNIIINSHNQKLNNIKSSLFNQLNNNYKYNLNQINYLGKTLRAPENIYNNKKKYLHTISKNIAQVVDGINLSQLSELNKFSRLLNSNSLQTNLKKGYSIIKKSNKIINKSTLINKEDTLKITFIDKSIDLKIKKIN